jgi:hypothetical protein
MLELLMRKTESEKRMEIFGSDPFKWLFINLL